MAKKTIKTKSAQNIIQQHKRGVSVTTTIKVNGALEPEEYEHLGAVDKPRGFEYQLRDIVINFMRILKSNDYPYRPSYRIASHNTSGNKSLLSRLSKEFGLEPLDTYYVLGDVIQQYHIMKLRQAKGASSEELIELSFKLGNAYQKALMFLKESNAKSKAAHHLRTDPDVAESIARLAKTEMTSHEAFSHFVSDINGVETVVDNNLCVTYFNGNDMKKKMTFKRFQNILSEERKKNIPSSK
jgi:hypothetical protein